MSKFVLEIKTDNAAFTDEGSGIHYPGPEVARILREVADRVQNHHDAPAEGKVHDYNGNTVGTFEFVEG